VLKVELLKCDGQALPPVVLRDVELEEKNLMEKNYHRGLIDVDLGSGAV
jgi:hypothetical protein